jgi:hypothetical protein
MRDMSPREEEYREKGVQILAINAFEDPQVGRDWIASSGLDFRWAFADESVTQAFGVATVPTQILLDRDGRIAWTSNVTSLFGGANAVFEAIDGVLRGDEPGP